MRNIAITGAFIKLDALLKFANLVSSGGEAKLRIAAGEVLVDGVPCTQRGRKIYPDSTVTLDGETVRVTAE